MKKRKVLLAGFFLTAFAFSAAGQAVDLDARRDVIRYGIESELLELVSTLQSEKEDRLNDELVRVLEESRSVKLREALLRFFAEREWAGASSSALNIVDFRDEEAVGSVLAALSYLSAVKSRDAIPEAREILEAQESRYLSAAVRLLGRAGGEAESEVLLGLFDSPETTEALKQDTIRALGDIRSQAAVDNLIAILEEESAGKATRMYSAEALGKIGDPNAVSALVKAANGEDPQVRASAISALALFKGGASEAAVVQGIRDSVAAVRIAAVKSASALLIKDAEPFLRYRARHDPEKKVREESIRALASYGGIENMGFLRNLLEDRKIDTASRTAAFTALLESGGSRGDLDKVLELESKEKDSGPLKAFLRVLAQSEVKDAAPLVETYLLKSPDFTARIAGIDWVRRNKALSLKPVVAALAETDKVESVKKRAATAMEDL